MIHRTTLSRTAVFSLAVLVLVLVLVSIFAFVMSDTASRAGASAQLTLAQTESSPAPLLCQNIRSLDHLRAHRANAFPQNREVFGFGINRSSSDTMLIREVARALCALPRFPNATLHCPADLGISYQLTFSARSRTFPQVTLEATGCETVHGLGTTRWTAESPKFWIELGRALNIAHPSSVTFRGVARGV
ncbi:MAG TPA: hypothetical protein VNE42_12130 [Acidimicrobiales bacterium]|nr:hypothetical protein [Acidimicrobiales bacterium]